MMNFKDFQFSIGKLTTAAQSHLARKNPLQKQDTKALSNWIFQERNDLYVMRMLAYHHSETNKAMEEWIKEECQSSKEEDNKDLKDIGDKLLALFGKQSEIEEAYAAKYQQYRRTLKAIREREERLTDIREKKRALKSRIDNLTRSNSRSPKTREFSKELESLERDTHDTEMEMSDFKRFALREAFYLRFNAMHEMAEKLVIIAGFAKYLVDLIDIEPTPAGQPHRRPYEKSDVASQILTDALRALETWTPAEGIQRPTLPEGFGDDTLSVTGDDDRLSVANNDGAFNTPSTLLPEFSSPVPSAPALPPRSKAAEAAAAEASAEASASAATTGDVKRRDEREVDFDQLDLYGPPPAYSPNERAEAYSPRNSDEPPVLPLRPEPAHPQAYTEISPEFERITLSDPPVGPTPTNTGPPIVAMAPERQNEEKTLEETDNDVLVNNTSSSNIATPVPQHILEGGYTQSPQPVHQEQLHYQQQQQQHHHNHQQQSDVPLQHVPWAHPGSTYSQASQLPEYYQYNYPQLYRQVTRHQRQAPPQIPYDQFQQQYQRQRVDAGGFRIPPASVPAVGSSSQYPSADEEKQALAQRYGTQ